MWKLPRRKQKEPQKVSLFPPYVEAELETMSVLVRGVGDEDNEVLVRGVGDEDNEAIVYVTTAGPTGRRFRYYSDAVQEIVRKLWPELTDYQVMRAGRWITAEVRAQLQQREAENYLRGANQARRRRRNWVTDWGSDGY